MAFDAAERNGRFGRIQCQRGKESSNRGKRRVFPRPPRTVLGGLGIPLLKDSESQSRRQSHPNELSEN